jgi:hypothetical protein
MNYNTQWQLPLLAVLLLTINACKNREAKSVAQIAPAPAADLQVATNTAAAPGDLKVEKDYYKVAADTVAVAVENEIPAGGQDKQQRPNQHQAPAPAANPDWDKKIIKNATLSVEVKEYARFNELMRAAVKQSGGYIAQEEQNESEYKIENSVTIKVPVDQFDNTVLALTPGKEKILVKKITSQDVTGEVVDTKSRLEAKRQVRLRYLDLLTQAKNMEEILQVQNEINDIQENMETAAGRIQYLTHSAAFSTIQLNYFQVLDPQARDVETPPGFGKKILLALGEGLTWVGELIILLLTLWPVWLALLAGWMLYRKYRPAKQVRVATPAPPTEQGQ